MAGKPSAAAPVVAAAAPDRNFRRAEIRLLWVLFTGSPPLGFSAQGPWDRRLPQGALCTTSAVPRAAEFTAILAVQRAVCRRSRGCGARVRRQAVSGRMAAPSAGAIRHMITG